ncbi:MAG: histidine--tRNA ligase [Thermoguttaceae bacterium]|nr:histidine--tRNA ligase [Thermoguttaceae bacterium]
MITPQTLKGFRDYLPETMIPRRQIINAAAEVYESFGFAPIDTPALEYLEILQGKGSDETDKQMYKFQDAGGRNVGMRFDLTVPLARFSAQHINELGTPFKRYHIAPVWRGENTQHGRYREFVQCDFDTIGTTGVESDIEAVLVIYTLFCRLGFKDQFVIHVNNRQILNGVLETMNLRDKSVSVLRAIDKLPKVGTEKVIEELKQTAGATDEQCESLLAMASLTGTNDEVLNRLSEIAAQSELAQAGIARLRQILDGAAATGIADSVVQIDLSIARGLDYYTGVIFETFLTELPKIGSVCSGGRYDNLAELYTKQQLPGIGASLGLDRLLAAMEELGKLPDAKTPADVLILFFDSERLNDYIKMSVELRSAGVKVELYPEPKKIKAQMQYADRKGFKYVVIAGSKEFEEGKVQIKNLADGSQRDVPMLELASAFK